MCARTFVRMWDADVHAEAYEFGSNLLGLVFLGLCYASRFSKFEGWSMPSR